MTARPISTSTGTGSSTGTGTGTVAHFTSLEEASADELRQMVPAELGTAMVDHLLAMLRASAALPTYGFQIDRCAHGLQTATRAHDDGASEELVVAALLHDVADAIASTNHGAVAAAIFEPYVDEEIPWILRHHTVFLGYHFWDKLGLDRDARDQYRDSPHFDAAARFVAWDQASFDGSYPCRDLEFFEPMVRSVFSSPRNPS